MTCPACTRSLTNRHCTDVNPECPDCVLRDMATMPANLRDAAYDAIERLAGLEVRRKIEAKVRDVREEIFNARGWTT